MRAGQETIAGNAYSALQQLVLAAAEGPGVCEALASVVAGEDDDRVARDPAILERPLHAPDLVVHRGDHAAVGLLRAAVPVDQVAAAQALGLRLVARRLPRPVGRAEVQAEQERPAGPGVVADHLHRAVAEQVGRVAFRRDLLVLLPEIRGAAPAGVPVVVDRAAAIAVEVVVAALMRAEIRQTAQMPLADQRRAVPGLLQQRWQGGMIGRQADAPAAPCRERLFQPERAGAAGSAR